MEDLIGLLVPLLAVAGWLFGLFNKQDEEGKEPGKPVRRHQSESRPVPKPEGNMAEQEVKQKPKTSVETYTDAQNYYEKKVEKLAEIQDGLSKATDTLITKDSIGTEKDSKPQVQVKVQSGSKKPKLKVRKNLSKKGLAESIVMAEVLGPPRAVKPYQDVIQQKRK
ncbi:hypothetical protein [Sediminibacillus massiliensis]|uniref:hypothetical protein n=1 Tax=Sediminibacillus massiliensis TaxID=1926277 RepID=UPI0009883459|nr:hypothetical protein [Sediminibacillus massiliensis]